MPKECLYDLTILRFTVENCGRSDFVYVLDSSASIGDQNYWRLKLWTIDVMKGFRIGVFETRVGCVTYSTDATKQWGLTGLLITPITWSPIFMTGMLPRG